MKKRILTLFLAVTMILTMFTACGSNENSEGGNVADSGNSIVEENTEIDSIGEYGEDELRSLLYTFEHRFETWKNDGKADKYIIIEVESINMPLLCMYNTEQGKCEVFTSAYEVTNGNNNKFIERTNCIKYAKEGYLYSVISYIINDEIYHRIEGNATATFLGAKRKQDKDYTYYRKDGQEYIDMTEEEFNEAIEETLDCEWIEFSSVENWYTNPQDMQEAYENRLK